MQDRRKQPCDVVAARIRINAAVELRVTAQTHMGRCLLHVREYILGDTNEFVATQKGISLSIDKLDAVLEAVRELRGAGSTVGDHAIIQLGNGNEARFAIHSWQGATKADIRLYYKKAESGDMLPTKKGVRINLGLLGELERGLEALEGEVSA